VTRLFGIANCDTVKKARAWLDRRGVAYEWVDFRKAPPHPDEIARWSRAAGWEALLNRRGTTWRQLSAEAQARVTGERAALALMAEKPTLIRRPVIEDGDDVLVGFDAERYARRFGRA
jgi:Spx/MgsR family transcriptional regulator